MNATSQLVTSCLAGDREAFTELVKRHQNFALGYAFSLLGDFHQAQDVVQESFVIAFSSLSQLEKPEAFPGWLRGIIHFRCQRRFRMKPHEPLPIEDHLDSSGAFEDEGISDRIQQRQEQEQVLEAIRELPERQRAVITLYYLEERPQKEVAEFLGLNITQVNNDLHEGRRKLKGRLADMAKETFREKRLSEEFAKNIGEILAIQGVLVDAQIKGREKPRVFDLLGTKTSSNQSGADLVVVQRLKNGRIRCISTGDGKLSKDASLYPSGNYEKAIQALNDEGVKQAVESIRGKGERRILETGIKAIDLLCPIVPGGTVGIFGKEGVGRAVLLMELLHQRKKIDGDLSLFFFVPQWNVLGTQDMLETDPTFASDVNDNIQTAWIVHPKAGDPTYARAADYLDTRLYFSPIKAAQNLWPALDPLHSASKHLDPKVVGESHFQVAKSALETLQRAHDLMLDPVYLEQISLGAIEAAQTRAREYLQQRLSQLSPKERTLVHRARRLERYLTQPFFVAQDFSGRPGTSVPLAKTLEGAERILNGEYDQAEESELLWRGSI